MSRDILLALGLVLTPATQLRMAGLPIGAGELLLGAWLFLGFTAQLAGGTGMHGRAFGILLLFWSTLWLALSIGLVSGFALDLFQDLPAMRHDMVAYLLAMSLGILLALEFRDAERRKRMCALFTWVGTTVLLVQLAGGMGLRLLPVGDAWFYDRFRGWSENPNQAGFLAAVLAFMAMHVLQTAATSLGKLSALSCAAVAIGCGILTRSDSFMVALLIGASAWVAVTALSWLRTLRAGVMLRGAAVVLGLLSVPLAMTSFAPFGAAALERVGQTSEAMYAENDQGETRLELWSEALGRTVQSAFLGFGPGPQLTSKAYKRPPPSKFEAHNTFLDLLTQGGLLAVAAFLCICAAALRTAWRARLAGLVALLCALAAFSMFHLVLRQPIFWFAVVLSLLALPALPRAPGGASIRDRSGAMP